MQADSKARARELRRLCCEKLFIEITGLPVQGWRQEAFWKFALLRGSGFEQRIFNS